MYRYYYMLQLLLRVFNQTEPKTKPERNQEETRKEPERNPNKTAVRKVKIEI
jgi:hypothetical protein